MTHKLLPLVAGQPQAKPGVHDRAGDLVLQFEQLGRFPIVRARPELLASGNVHQANRDAQSFDLPLERTDENRFNAKLAPRGQWITGRPFVGKDNCERPDANRAQLRDLVNEALSDTITQILVVLAGGRVRQGQYGQRSLSRSAIEHTPPRNTRARHDKRGDAKPQHAAATDRQRQDAGRFRLGRWRCRRQRRQRGDCGLHTIERSTYVSSRRVTASRVPDETAVDCRTQLRSDVWWNLDGFITENRRAQLEWCVARERP